MICGSVGGFNPEQVTVVQIFKLGLMIVSLIELFALLLAVLVILKFFVFLLFPRLTVNLATFIHSKNLLLQLVLLLLGGVIFYLLLIEISVVKIYASMLFGSFLFAFTMAPFSPQLLEAFKDKFHQDRFWSEYALVWLVWLFLSVWVLMELLFG